MVPVEKNKEDEMIKLLFKKYPTLNNKCHAVLLLLCGFASVWIDHDATVCIFFLLISLMLFLAKDNLID